jgi:hypothetical protein
LAFKSERGNGRENSDTNPVVGYLSVLNTPLITVGFREFGAERKDLSRVVDPYENNDERARRAVSRRHIAASDV